MKWEKRTGKILTLLFLVISLSACGRQEKTISLVRIVLEDGEGFTAKQQVYDVEAGSSLTIPFTVEPGYEVQTCSYPDYEIEEGPDESSLLVLAHVRYATRIRISCTEQHSGDDRAEVLRIEYQLNGGSRDGKSEDSYCVIYRENGHLRVNTDTAEGIERNGYTFLGWNTAADGSGTHIGAGSKVTVPDDRRLILYAEWMPWTEASCFTYVESEEAVTLTGYTGTKERSSLVIPGSLNGKPVEQIAEGFADGLSLHTLVLPDTVRVIEERAFSSFCAEEFFFFDNLEQVWNSSFGGDYQIQTYHINAVWKPRYQNGNDNAQFAEDMDRLILSERQKKMIFFAGCSMAYGLCSDQVAEAFQDFVICNMGVAGGLNAEFQVACIAAYLNRGDVFVHAPEEMSPYQLFAKFAVDSRIFVMTEGNYDLLALADLSGAIGMWGAFGSYNAERLIRPEGSYDDQNEHYNTYGDITFFREDSEAGTSFGSETIFAVGYLADGTDTLANMNEVYGRLLEKGVTVYVSFAPVNGDAIPEKERKGAYWDYFSGRLKQGLTSGITVISEVEDYILDGSCFYDEDYHLSSRGAKIRTERLIQDIRVAQTGE